MSTSRYKGFSILAKPYPLHESKCWTVDLEIRRSGRSQPFALEGRYESEDDAQNACAGMGRPIIDGGIPGWSVDHLRVPALPRRSFGDMWQEKSMRLFLCAGVLILGLGVYAFLRLARD